MTINDSGLVFASRDELMAIWLFGYDLFKLFAFSELLLWCKFWSRRADNA